MHLLFDGTHIWVYNQEDLTLSKLRASDGVLVSTYSTRTLRPGNLPMPTAVGSDGIHIWLAQNGVDGLVMLRISDGVVEGTYPWWSESALPTHGRVVFGAAYVWTSNWYENTVVKSRTVGLC